jgi:hypothetical protein
MKEQWKKIEFAPDYAVSDQGRVIRQKRGARGDSQAGREMSQFVHQNHRRVALYVDTGNGNKKYRNYRVDELVLSAFVRPRKTRSQTPKHKDRDPNNNHLSNLNWGTR